MKKLKHLILLSASLLILFSSFATGKPENQAKAFQSKSTEYHLASIVADDLDDDYVSHAHEFSVPLIAYLFTADENNFEKLNYFHPAITALPCFLRIRNLRI